MPVVKLGKPEYTASYETFEKEGVTYYIPKTTVDGDVDNVTLKLRNVLGVKSLVVEGILAYKKGGYGKKEF